VFEFQVVVYIYKTINTGRHKGNKRTFPFIRVLQIIDKTNNK